jgi:hypothetical protein
MPGAGGPGQPTEEEMRAALEAELKRLRVEDVLIQTIVSLVNLGGRKAGLAPGAEDERDLGQLKVAIDGVAALLPIVEPLAPEPDALGPVRDALSQLQLAYTQLAAGGAPAASATGAEAPAGDDAGTPGDAPPAASETAPPEPGQPGEAQRTGRLWVPGQ